MDFLIRCRDDLILIEAKGIEAPRRAQVASSNKVMASAYKKSVVKALSQAHKVIEQFKEKESVRKIFILVVTYKDIFLGSSHDAWDEFIRKTLETKYGIKNSCITPDVTLFLSVSEFDRVLQASEGNTDKLFSVIEKNVENMRRENLYTFNQSLNNLEISLSPDSHLENSFDEYWDAFISKAKVREHL